MIVFLDLSIVVFLLSVPVLSIAMALALIRLRSRHKQAWDDLGRPTFFRAMLRPGRGTGALREFIQEGGHKKLRDPVLSFLFSLSLLATWAGAVAFLLTFLLDVTDTRNAKDFLSKPGG
jgi:hypothetical protein